MNKNEIIKYINDELKGYQGYIQYSNRPIDKKTDIFIKDDPKVDLQDGFIYEAYFCNGTQSISIKQINNSWLVSKTDISNIDLDDKNNSDIKSYISDIQDFNHKVKMAQIWDIEEDKLCENMKVKKLSKVVFVGFQGVEK